MFIEPGDSIALIDSNASIRRTSSRLKLGKFAPFQDITQIGAVDDAVEPDGVKRWDHVPDRKGICAGP